MLRIDETQRTPLRDDVLRHYKEDMREHLRAFAPERAAAAGDEALAAFVDRRVDDAHARGLTMRGPTRLWLEVSVVLGAAFESDPQHAPLMPDLDPAEWPMPYAERLQAAVGRYLAACFGADRSVLGRVVAAAAGRELPLAGASDDHLVATVEALWPERLSFAGEAPIRALAAATDEAAARAGLVTPRGRLMTATLGLCFGAGVLDDPLYPFVHARLFGDAPEEERVARTMDAVRTYAAAAAKRLGAGG